MSRVNQILIWVTLSFLAISLTTVYLWPENQIPIEVEVSTATAPTVETVVGVEDLVVTVLNGSQKEGMAKNVQDYLLAQNIYVTRIGNTPRRNYAVSEILYHPEAFQAAQEFAQMLKVKKLTPATSFESRLFVTLVLGADFEEVLTIVPSP
jgi:hypothetical protein